MSDVFADTSFYVAVSNPRDSLHHRAIALAGKVSEVVVTTEYVLIETGNFLSRSGERAVFVQLMAQLENDPDTKIIPSDSELFAEGLDLFARRPDKDWSLTDCISFVVMQSHELTDSLTADHHFAQAGFRVLLADDE